MKNLSFLFILPLFVGGLSIFNRADAQTPAFAWVRVEGKWGLIDAKGQFLLQPVHTFAERPDFDEDSLAVLNEKGKYGMLRQNGRWQLPLEYDLIWEPGNKGCRKVEKNKKIGLIDKKGRWIAEPQFDDLLQYDNNNQNYEYNYLEFRLQKYSDGLTSKYGHDIPKASIGRIGENVTLFDQTGKTIVPPNFTLIRPLSKKYLWVLEGGKVVTDSSMLTYLSEYLGEEYSAKTALKVEGGKWYVHSAYGQKLPENAYDEVQNEGATNEPLYGVKQNNQWGLVDSNGALIVKPQFDQIIYVRNGAIVAKQKDRYGMTAYDGQILAPYEYDSVEHVGEFLYAFLKKETRDIYSLKTGKKVLENIEIVRNLYLWGLNKYHVDFDPMPAIPASEFDKYQSENPNTFHLFTKNKLSGAINSEGVLVLPFEYDDIGILNKKYLTAEKKGKQALFDKMGKQLTGFDYDYIIAIGYFDPEFLVCNGCVTPDVYYKKTGKKLESFERVGGQWGLLNSEGKTLVKPFPCDYILSADSPRVVYSRDCKYGMRDYSGAELLPPVYQTINRQGDCIIAEESEQTQLLDGKFKTIVPPAKQAIELVIYGIGDAPSLFVVKNEEKTGVINSKGEWVIPQEIDKIQTANCRYLNDSSYNLLISTKNNKLGLLNSDYKTLLPNEYDEIDGSNSIKDYAYNLQPKGYDLLISVKKDGKEAVYSVRKEAFATPFVDKVIDFRDKFVLVTDKGQTGMLNADGGIAPFTAKSIEGASKYGAALKNSTYSLLTDNGEKNLPAEYEWIYPFNWQLSIVKKGEFYGVINETGEIVLPIEYTDHQYLLNGYYHLVKKDGKWGIFDHEAKFTAPPTMEYDQIVAERPMLSGEEAFFLVKSGKKYGLIDVYGKLILPVEYDMISAKGYSLKPKDRTKLVTGYHYDYSEEKEVAFMVQKNNRFGLYDKKGNQLLPIVYEEMGGYETTYSMENIDYVQLKKDDRYGLYHYLSQRLIPCEYDDVSTSESEGLIAVNIGRAKGDCEYKPGKWGYIDTLGKWVIQAKLEVDHATGFYSCGYAQVSKDNQNGLINRKGKITVPPVYQEIQLVGFDLAIVRAGNFKKGVIDMQNKIVIDTIYNHIKAIWRKDEKTKKVKPYFAATKNSETELLDQTGKPVWKDKYAVIKQVLGSELLLVNQGGSDENNYDGNRAVLGGKWGMVNFKGQTVCPIEYSSIGGETDAYVDNLLSEAFADRPANYTPEAVYDTFSRRAPRLLKATENELCGYLNLKGKPEIDCKYLWAQDNFENDMDEVFVVEIERNDTVTKILNRKGKVLSEIPGYYNESLGIDRIVTSKNELFGLYTRDGKNILPHNYLEITTEDSKKFPYRITSDSGKGLADAKGKIALQPNYSNFYVWQEQQFIVEQNELCGILDRDGKTVFPLVYEYIAPNSDYSAIASKAGIRLVLPDGSLMIPTVFEQAEVVGAERRRMNAYD